MDKQVQNLTNQVQTQLAGQLLGMFEQVMQTRQVAHQADLSLARQSTDSIVGSYSNVNAGISGSLNLIPGPTGMVLVIPEILLIMRNQISMVYDIGASYGKEAVITKELLLGIVNGATGASAASLLVIRGSKVLIKRTTLSTFKHFVAQLSGRVTQQALKSAIGKWLPGVGAVAIAAWSYYMTRQIGKQAKEIFEKEISWEGNTTPSDSVLEDLGLSSSSGESENIDFLRVKAIINLIRADGVIEEEERVFFKNMLQNVSLSKDEISQIRESLQSKSKLPVDFKVLAQHPDEVVGLMVDLVAVAKRDGNFHITEKMYIKQVGQALNLDAADVEEMMSVVV